MEQKSYKKTNFKRKKQYNDTQLFVDTIQFLRNVMEITKNLSKDFKSEFGDELVVKTRNMVIYFSLSYTHKALSEKLSYSLKAYNLVREIDIFVRIMSECGVLTAKQTSNLMKFLGNILVQLEGWINSIGGNLNDEADGVLETEEA